MIDGVAVRDGLHAEQVFAEAVIGDGVDGGAAGPEAATSPDEEMALSAA